MSIIVRVVGGLGNQLFQYAFARALSTKQNTSFRLDINAFSTFYTLHKYSLKHLHIQENLTKDTDFLGFVWIRKQRKIFDTFYKKLRLKTKILPFYYPEHVFHFDPSVFSKKNTYFDGFWQTEKYFKNIRQDLLKELTLKEPFSEYSQTIFEKIRKSNAVSIHVRRADYVSDPQSSVIFGVCSMEYYRKAIAHMVSNVESPNFFIFSDDHAWASENFKSLPYPITCITNSADKNYEDLMLMSNCKHNVIANSSFSWWGAWLNENDEKIVIAPENWFRTKKTSTDTKDVIPDGWIKI